MERQSRLSDPPIRPTDNSTPEVGYGSDVIVEQLSRLNMPYVALVPGSSYRGLHDSLVNYNGNSSPEMLVCLHEEHAIAIAHGWAKVTGTPIAAAVHANVGLMHATMAIYNAFCDRVPMLILGATGPLDAAQRRPWIDWIHTATDQAALIRPFIKWDDQPHSANAAVNSLLQATSMTTSKPSAPVYVCLDVRLQEDSIDPASINYPNTSRHLNTPVAGPASKDIGSILSLLKTSTKPLFLFGRVNRAQESWDRRIILAEHFSARVLTDIKQAAAFPHPHPLHAAPPALFPSDKGSATIRSADLVISFDWVDLASTLTAAYGAGVDPSAKIAHVSLDSALHNGWSKDHFGSAPVDLPVYADPDECIEALVAEIKSQPFQAPPQSNWPQPPPPPSSDVAPNGPPLLLPNGSPPPPSSTHDKPPTISMTTLAEALTTALPPSETCLIRAPLSWPGTHLHTPHPLSFLGMDGGAGIASGPGQAVGSALALHHLQTLALTTSASQETPKLIPVAVLGDGDTLMGLTALWTAARYRLPLLVVVANNTSYFNDEVHQRRVAVHRGREWGVVNQHVGMRLDDPVPDLGALARGLGLRTVGPGGGGDGGGASGGGGMVEDVGDLAGVLAEAVERVRGKGESVLVDVRVTPEGYEGGMKGDVGVGVKKGS